MLTLPEAAERLNALAQELTAELAQAGGQRPELVRARLLAALDTPIVDARAKEWTVRIQLVGPDSAVVADTDPAAGPGAPGAQTAHGLHGAVVLIADLVDSYHQGRAVGIGIASLRARLGSLRTQLSKGRGTALWRIRYTVENEQWIALATVTKAQL